VPRGAKSRMRRTETPKSIWIKFCMVVDIPDVVTYANFGDHRLRGFWVAGAQISPSPIDFHRRPFNTLALPCERVTTPAPHHSVFYRLDALPAHKADAHTRLTRKALIFSGGRSWPGPKPSAKREI